MEIYDFDDYKVALRQLLEMRRAQYGGRFTFEKMAQACGIQKTYLSRVLNGKSHLNADQLFTCCRFLKLKDLEVEFLMLVRDRQTCENYHRKTTLEHKIARIISYRLKSESVLDTKDALSLNVAAEYYLNFNLHLVHLFLTVPRFTSDLDQICFALGISQDELNDYISKLLAWGLVREVRGKIIAGEVSRHLSEESPVFNTFAILQRIKTIERMSKGKTKEDYYFSALISADPEFQIGLRKKILSLLEDAQKDAGRSKTEDVFQLNIDLFKWS